MSLVTTPTHKDANSYVSKAEADEYFEGYDLGDSDDRHTFWHSKNLIDQENALKMAAKVIDKFRFFREKFYDDQALEFPRDNAKTVTGTVDSGTADYFLDSNLQNDDDYPDDYFEYWCCEITEGTNEWDKRRISSSTRVTGKVDLESSFPSALDSTSQFKLIEKIPDAVKQAQCEIALWLLQGKHREGRAKLQAAGVKSFSIGDFSETFGDIKDIQVPKEAEDLLEPYISKIGHFE